MFARGNQQGIDIGGRTGDPPGFAVTKADHDGDLVTPLHDVAADPGFAAQPAAQQFPALVKRQAGVGNVDLQIVAPIMLIAAGRPCRTSRLQHDADLIEHPPCRHFAGHALLHQRRGHGKGLHHQRIGVGGAPHGPAQPADQRQHGSRQQQPQACQHAFGDDLQVKFVGLAVQQRGFPLEDGRLLLQNRARDVGQRLTGSKRAHRDLDGVGRIGHRWLGSWVAHRGLRLPPRPETPA